MIFEKNIFFSVFLYLFFFHNLYFLELTKDKEIKVFDINSKLQTNYGIYLNFGKTNIQQGMYLDFNFDSILLANKEKVNWGINCPDAESGCEVLNDQQTIDYYQYSAYQYIQGTIPFIFDNMDKKENHDNIKIQLITETINKWPLALNGVVGFSPQSIFANFIRNNFQNDNSFLFSFNPKYNQQTQPDKLRFNISIYQNPSFKRENHLAKFKLAKDQRYWNFHANIEIKSVGLNLKKQKICLQNSYNDILYMKDVQVYCRAIISQICKEQNILNCNKSNTDISRAPELKFEVGEAKVAFEGTEYLYFDEKSNRVNCRFGWLISVRTNDCSEDTDVAVGRLFYSKLQPVLKYNNDGTSEIIFTKNFNIRHKTNWKYVIIGLSITLFVVIFLACLLHCKKTSEDNKYHVV